MMSLPIGFLSIIVVLFFSIDADNLAYYWNIHAVTIVIGGSIAILFFATPTEVLFSLKRALAALFSSKEKLDKYQAEFQTLSKTKNLDHESKNPLIRYAVTLWQAGVSPDLFVALLSQKKDEIDSEGVDAVQALRNLAKYPPALGMTGTVIGLVALFSQLGLDNREGLGKALALALTATFYGLVLANGLITPLADRLHVAHMWKKRFYEDSYQILLLVNRGEAIELIREDGFKDAA
jgi:chemotaxis protein MotA